MKKIRRTIIRLQTDEQIIVRRAAENVPHSSAGEREDSKERICPLCRSLIRLIKILAADKRSR